MTIDPERDAEQGETGRAVPPVEPPPPADDAAPAPVEPPVPVEPIEPAASDASAFAIPAAGETVPDPAADEAGPDDAPGEDETKQGTDWLAELRGLLWLILAVLAFHSFVAKPFYIPSESMMPTMLVGDRLVVTKYPYGYSYVSPSFHILPFIKGRLFGQMPTRGDIVILKPPQADEDYIKRVVGLPGDRLIVADGVLILNGVPVKRGPMHMVTIPDYGGVMQADGRQTCDPATYGDDAQVRGGNGKIGCRVPVVRETLPNGVSFDTIDLGFRGAADNFGPVTIPAGHVFLMGDNRDNSADSRFSTDQGGLGGPVPWENLGGRAEFITFSFDGSGSWNPFTWFGALRGGRAGTSLHPDKEPAAKP